LVLILSIREIRGSLAFLLGERSRQLGLARKSIRGHNARLEQSPRMDASLRGAAGACSVCGEVACCGSAPLGGIAVSDTEKSGAKTAPLPWVILSGLLGVFAVGSPIGEPAAKKKEPEKKEVIAEAAPFQISGKDPLKPVYDFYATHDGKWNPEEDLRRHLHNYQVEFLITTVPDPIDTPYGYAFDQVVDAVQRAVEKKDGYILDRSWLPWEIDKRPKAKTDDKTEPNNYRESYPGVLLFRHGKHTDRKINQPGLCVVFLVGETPLSGLHKRAFTRALKMMASGGQSVTDPVRVIGPYFSGSQTSLQFVVGDWWAGLGDWWAGLGAMLRGNPLFKFDVITGNASAIRTKDFFDLDPYSDGHPNWQPGKFKLTSTVIPTRPIVSAILRYMSKRDGCKSDEPIQSQWSHLPGKVAILAESNTGFGKNITANNKDDVLLLRFPLHISRVKNEYTQAFRKKDEQAGLKNTDTLVPSTLEEPNQSGEGVPSQGGVTTTAINAQALSNILATIGREQCQYVGVVASDTRDKLFLIRLIREYCPDVHVFVTDADQLLLHPDYRYWMRGVIVGSTYPLFGQNQTWVNPDSNERILFANVAAQGCYNATLMHLGLNRHLLEYGPPRFVSTPLDEHGEAQGRQRPPIWISVVSPNGSFVPLQVFTEYEDKEGYVRLNPNVGTPKREVALTYPGALLPFGLALLAFWSALVYFALFTRSSRLFWAPVSTAGDFSLPQLCYRNLLLGSQVVLALPVLALVHTHAQANHFSSIWMSITVGATAAIVVGFLLGMLKPLCWPPSRLMQFAHWLRPRALMGGRLELGAWTFANLALVTIVCGFAVLFLSRFWIHGGPTRRTLFFFRAIDLTSGLSPMTPLLFMSMGFAAWAYFQLKRAHQMDRFTVPPPFPADQGDAPQEGSLSRLNDLDRAVQEEVRHDSLLIRHAKAVIFVTLVLAALGLAIWLQSLPTVEGWSWDGLFYVGFWSLYALTVSILLRLFFLWRHTKRLLDGIALIPMMRSFARLPQKVSEVFGKYLLTKKPKIEHLHLPIHQLRLLAEAVEKTPDAPVELRGLNQISDALDKRLREGLADQSGKTSVRHVERDLRGKLSAVSAGCLAALAPRWNSLPVEEAFGNAPATATPSSEPAWVPLAENVVATQITLYLGQFFAQLRGLLVAAMVCLSFLLLASTSYPFHPEHLLLISLLGLSGAGIAGVFWVLLEMNRDEVVSRVLKTTPGKFSLDSGFIGSFVTYIVPVVGLLTAQLSGSFRWILEPLMRVMK